MPSGHPQNYTTLTDVTQRYGPPMGQDWSQDWGTQPSRDAAKVRLRDVLRPRRTTIDYLYDFGDGWEHRLTVTKLRQGESARPNNRRSLASPHSRSLRPRAELAEMHTLPVDQGKRHLA